MTSDNDATIDGLGSGVPEVPSGGTERSRDSAGAGKREELLAGPDDNVAILGIDDIVPEAPTRGAERAHPQTGAGARTRVFLGPDDLECNILECIQALRGEPDLFQRDSELVQVLPSATGGAHYIKAVPAVQLRERLARHLTFQCEKDGLLVGRQPPGDLAQSIWARGHWQGIPVIDGVVNHPFLRPDGTVCDERGYDAVTRTYLSPSGPYPKIAPNPTQTDARAALEQLAEPFADFPWRSCADLATVLAAILTGVGRAAIGGPCPGFLIEASARSSGKSITARLISRIVSGEASTSAWSERDEDERRKSILAHLAEAREVVFIDNLKKPIDSAALDRLLTSTTYSDRVLGVSKVQHYPVRALFLFTANNAVVKGDSVRRLLPARMESKLEFPEDRPESEFRFPDVEQHVAENRLRLVVAALTALRGWIVADRPRATLQAWGSYESWSALVRNTLVWAGWPDPLETRREMRASEEESLAPIAALHDELEKLCQTHGGPLTAAQIATAATTTMPGLAAALSDIQPRKPGDNFNGESVGYALRKIRGRLVQGRRVVTIGGHTKRGLMWEIDRLTSKS